MKVNATEKEMILRCGHVSIGDLQMDRRYTLYLSAIEASAVRFSSYGIVFSTNLEEFLT